MGVQAELVDRVRQGAVIGRDGGRRGGELDVEVFDSGYDSLPVGGLGVGTPRSAPPPRVSPARSPRAPISASPASPPAPRSRTTGPEIIERTGAAPPLGRRGDRFESPTGDVLSAASTVYDFGYSDEVEVPPELEALAGVRTPARSPASGDRATGPLRVFVGRPGVTEEPDDRPLPVGGAGPVWDASALEVGDGDWGDEGWGDTDFEALDAAPIASFGADDDDELLEAGDESDLLEAVSSDEFLELGAADELPTGDGFTLSADSFLGDDHSGQVETEPLFPPATQRASASRPWWVSPSESVLDADPAPHRTGEHSAVVPELEVGRPRLEAQLAQPLPEERPTGEQRRQAPWLDPDPWTTGAFRKIGVAPPEDELPPLDSLDTLGSKRRSGGMRPGTTVPELRPVVRDRGESAMPTQLLLAALVVVGVVAIAVQMGRNQQGGLLGGVLPAGDYSTPAADAGVSALPPRRLVEPTSAGSPTAPPAVANVQPLPPVKDDAPVPGAVVPSEPAPETDAASIRAASTLPPLDRSDRLDPEGETGMLKVLAPDRARVYIDGRYLGRAPVSPQRMATGRHEVRVSGRRLQANVAPGRLATLDFTR